MQPMIRVADVADLSALTALIERYWEFERIKGFDAARITTIISDLFRAPDRGRIWIAQEGGQSVGYLVAVYLFSLEYGGLMAEIDEFFVIPEKRSLRIGSALLDAASRTMAQQGIACVQLQLGTRNPSGKRFYERHGFQSLSGYEVLTKTLSSIA